MPEDGELILIHDNTVDRTTSGSGKVREMTLEEIKSLDADLNRSVFTVETNVFTGLKIIEESEQNNGENYFAFFVK